MTFDIIKLLIPWAHTISTG